MVTYQLFVRPALARLLGHRRAAPLDGLLEGELAAPAPGAKGRDRFLPARVAVAGGRVLVTPLPSRGSHDMTAHAVAGALLLRPAGCAPAAAGEPCCLLLASWTPG
jgi:molybdopterin molybdotransferase